MKISCDRYLVGFEENTFLMKSSKQIRLNVCDVHVNWKKCKNNLTLNCLYCHSNNFENVK